MGKRLAPIFAIMAMLNPLAGHALGLGDISMKSALNEPLNAEIQLLSVEKGDLSNLVIRLGSEEDFARVGADRAFFLTKIQFKVNQKPDGSSYIQLNTTDLVTEPFLDFVVEARWPRGRILREFTVLVDPPAMTQEAPAPIQQATTQPAMAQSTMAQQPAAQAAPTVTVMSAPAPAAQQPAPIPARANLTPVMSRDGVLSYGPVKRNDTLWEIANQMRPESVSVNQMMVALVKDNPEAFYNGNVNQLKAGYVLRVEDPTAIGAVSVAQADAEIERQRMEWQARKSGKLVKQTAVAGAGMSGGAASAGGAAGGARLKLVAPGSEGAGSGAGGAEVDQLRQDLLIAAEALDANRQETDELKARLAEMEEQLASMQRLITLKDDEMLALQKQLGKVPEDATKPAPAPMAETAPAEAKMAEAGEAEAPMKAEEAAEEEKPAAAEQPKRPVVVPPEEIEEPGLLEDPLILFGAGGAVVLGLIAWLLMRRRKMQDGFQESILNVSGDQVAANAVETVEAAGGESSMVSDFAMSEMSGIDGIQADATEVDPISEADVYLAYGRHQQAEDIIKDAMEKTPERHELGLKLLEVYFAAKNADAFVQQAEALHTALGDDTDPLWAKAVTMGAQLCPTHELFGGSAEAAVDPLQQELAGAVSEADEDLLDFDFDLDSADLDTAVAGADAGDSDDLDFDLDFDKVGDTVASSEDAVAEETTESSADTTGLDFDVSSLDFDLDQAESSQMMEADKGLEMAAAEPETDEGALDFDLGDLGESEEEAEALGDELSLDNDLASADDLSLDDMSLDMAEDMSAGGDMDLADSMEAEDTGLGGLGELSLEGGDDTLGEMADDLDDLGDELGGDIFAEVDEVGTKLDLAKAYVDMGDGDGARSILDEVLEEGNDEQKKQAEELLAQIG